MGLDIEFLESAAEDLAFAYVCEYIRTAKIFSGTRELLTPSQEYELCLGIVQREIGKLRRYVANGNVLHSIEDWQSLERIEARVERLWSTTKFVFSQSAADKAKGRDVKKGHAYTNLANEIKWKEIVPEQYETYSKQGKMVRTTGEAKNQRWEVAE